ncbi:MAG TPA: magnesium chelatase, partial [Planctomycetota bacterium]|nr:magnesium chelatase [Planctomycetota bacterium]
HRKLDLSDEEVIHFGIIPRTNRGIFTINELPDLAPRIQVGLLNILEERDVQIRGFPLRFPLDVLMVFTANPEDYTNRGSIITPLKDRIASQILTHYPRSIDDSMRITLEESWVDRDGDLPKVVIPRFLAEALEEIAFVGRQSEYVDQTSGVSARLPIAARELLVSQVERRVLLGDGNEPVARVVDLGQIVPAITGKVELVYEGEQEGAIRVARHLIGKACAAVFDRYFPDVIKEGSEPKLENDRYKPVLDWFAKGNRLELSDDSSDAQHRKALAAVPGLAKLAEEFLPSESQAEHAVAMELILEGLHQHSLLAKEDLIRGASYSDMLGVMLEELGR